VTLAGAIVRALAGTAAQTHVLALSDAQREHISIDVDRAVGLVVATIDGPRGLAAHAPE